MAVIAVIELAFDPYLELGDLAIRWQTVALTLAIVTGLGFAALLEGHMAPDRPGLIPASNRLPLEDMGYIVVGSVPGAVAGGRIVHGLSFWEAYAADPLSLFDPAVGTLSLLGAVLGGPLSAAYVARVIGAPIGRWADAAAMPLLLTLALAKLAQLLGGSGQGAPWQGPWSVAFVGAGPWVSPDAAVPAHPAQLYEALWLLAGIVVLGWLGRRSMSEDTADAELPDRAARPRRGRMFVAAVGWFVLGRFVVGFSWRDETILGPLNVEQAIALAVLLGGGVGLLLRQGSIVSRDSR